MSDYSTLPDELPEPVDDGAADHLAGMAMPALSLPATDGSRIALDEPRAGRTVLYVYPMTGVPGVPLPEGWNELPGARGCTPESCGFRDHHAELAQAGAPNVFGLSSQSTSYQAEMVQRLALPFPALSDESLQLADVLKLPTFEIAGMRLYRRLTMIVAGARIEHVFYPVFPPDRHAAEVLEWLAANPR
ncbi:MAG TPA: peroxiredoxin [Solirubrobacteraceae bacterium]|nr:peroxiredoxin [Solirubrobacteraceae bacterium]